MTDGCHTLLSDPNFRSEPKRFGAETATDVRLLLLEVSWTRQVTRAAINRESECQLALSTDGREEGRRKRSFRRDEEKRPSLRTYYMENRRIINHN